MRLAARDDASDGIPAGRSIAHCTTEDVIRTLFNKNSGVGNVDSLKKRKRHAPPTHWDIAVDNLFNVRSDASTEKKIEALRPVLAYWSNAHMRYMHRVIGVALSKARPGGEIAHPPLHP